MSNTHKRRGVLFAGTHSLRNGGMGDCAAQAARQREIDGGLPNGEESAAQSASL